MQSVYFYCLLSTVYFYCLLSTSIVYCLLLLSTVSSLSSQLSQRLQRTAQDNDLVMFLGMPGTTGQHPAMAGTNKTLDAFRIFTSRIFTPIFPSRIDTGQGVKLILMYNFVHDDNCVDNDVDDDNYVDNDSINEVGTAT